MSVITQIEFENPNKTYFSGQVVKGRASFTIGEEKTVRGVYVRVHGFGLCEWDHFDDTLRRTVKTVGSETYLDQRIYVVGTGADSSTDICIAAGTYTYPFECPLASEFPSTTFIPQGEVKYYANLVLDRPSWPIRTSEFPFTVIKPLDLSTDFSVQEPLEKTIDQSFYFCCLLCCWESKMLTMKVNLPKTGFVPGETIAVDVDVKNPSSEDVESFLIRVLKTVDSFANDGSDKTGQQEFTIVEETAPGILSGEDKKFTAKLIVPVTPPTDNTTSTIFKINYSLTVSAVVGLCHDNAICTMPIKIGTAVEPGSHEFSVGNGLPVVFQPTAPPSDSVASDPLLKKHLGSGTKTVEYLSNPPTYEEATTSHASNK